MDAQLLKRDAPAGVALLAWFRELHGLQTEGGDGKKRSTGDRARLRRAESPEDVVLVPAFHRLLASLGGAVAFPARPRWALIAGLLARVRHGDAPGIGLAAAMGQPVTLGGARATVSEPRVRRLLEADQPEAVYTQLRRAISRVDRPLDVLALARDLYYWDRGPGVRREWAYAYYAAAPETKAKGDSK